jgi:hypothetical protein
MVSEAELMNCLRGATEGMSWKHDRCSARACTPAYPIYKHTHTPLILDKHANKLNAHPAHIAQIFWIRVRSVGNGCNGMERNRKEWTRHGDKEGLNKANADEERGPFSSMQHVACRAEVG